MRTALASALVEVRRLTRSGLLIGLLACFAFFGLSGPALAVFLPQLLGAATGTDLLTITAAAPEPADGLALFTQSAMQLGLILAVAVAVTSLSWDARTGSSIFYRTRVRRLGALILPRLLVDGVAAVACYTIGLISAGVFTTIAIGPPASGVLLAAWVGPALYLVMAMAFGALVMAVFRRTAVAIALATVVLLVVPILSQVPGLSEWVPSSLLTGSVSAGPIASATVVGALCSALAVVVSTRTSLRREA